MEGIWAEFGTPDDVVDDDDVEEFVALGLAAAASKDNK